MANVTLVDVQIELAQTAATVANKLAIRTAENKSGIRNLAMHLLSLAQGARTGKVTLAIDSTTDLTKATGTITISGNPVADETITIGGKALTWKATPAAEGEIDIVAGDNTAMAADVAAEINAHSAFKGVISATSALGVVTVTAVHPGKAGNLITLAEASTNVAVGAAALAGGVSTQVSAARSWKMGSL